MKALFYYSSQAHPPERNDVNSQSIVSEVAVAHPAEILEFGALAAGEGDLQRVFEAAVKTIVTGLGTSSCHIYRRSAGAEDLQLVASNHPLLEDEAHESAVHALKRYPATLPDFRRACSVVIDGETGPFGVLTMISETPRQFSCIDLDFASSVAHIVSQALRRAHAVREQARLESAVDVTDEAIISFRGDGRIFGWNHAAENLFLYLRDQAIGHTVQMLFPQDLIRPALLDWVEESGDAPFEMTLRRSDATTVDAEVRFSPIRRSGHVAAATMIVRDVREKRTAVRALQMHGDILAHLPAAVMVWRLEDPSQPSSLRLVLGNPSADDLVGCSLAQRVGTLISDLPFGLDTLPAPEEYSAVVHNSMPEDFGERWLERSDGSRRAYHVQAFPLPDQSVGVVFNDVTERRLLSDRLQHTERLELIGRLAAGIAHDFNNLLTVITGYAELLQPMVASNEAALNDLAEIERASRSAHQLTQRLLAFGRRQTLQPAPVDLSGLLRSTRRLLVPLIGEDIQLIATHDEPVEVVADAGQIEQIVINLAVNARDAMPAGGKLFLESSLQWVTSRPDATHTGIPPGVYGVLQVSDTGIGMEPATLARVFEPFFTTKEGGRGTGLGLSTVYGIVQQSGGHITVDSAPGAGTTFRIYLPVNDSSGDSFEATPEQYAHGPAGMVYATGNHNVLLVEDDPTVRTLLRNALSRAGYTVLMASGPDEAIQLAGRFRGRIDLLLTDIVMPVQSGPELAARLTASFPGLQVLYMSGYVREAAGHRRLPKDAAFLRKPFLPSDLLEAMRRLLAACEQRVGAAIPETVM